MADSPADRISSSTSREALSISSSMRAGWMRPSWTRRSRDRRAISRRMGSKLRSVVDDQVHARQGLEGTDVAPLPSDDASLHVVGRQGDDADRRVAGVLHRTALHGRDDDLPRPAVGLPLGLLLQVLQTEPDEVLRLLLRLAEQDVLGLLAGQAGYLLELRVLLPNERLELRAPLLQGLLPVPQLVLLVGDPVQLPVQVLLLLLDLAFGPLKLVAPLLDVALGILTEPEDFLPGLGQALLLGPLGRLVRFLEHGDHPVLVSRKPRVVPGPQHQVADPGPGCHGHRHNKILHGTSLLLPIPHGGERAVFVSPSLDFWQEAGKNERKTLKKRHPGGLFVFPRPAKIQVDPTGGEGPLPTHSLDCTFRRGD